MEKIIIYSIIWSFIGLDSINCSENYCRDISSHNEEHHFESTCSYGYLDDDYNLKKKSLLHCRTKTSLFNEQKCDGCIRKALNVSKDVDLRSCDVVMCKFHQDVDDVPIVGDVFAIFFGRRKTTRMTTTLKDDTISSLIIMLVIIVLLIISFAGGWMLISYLNKDNQKGSGQGSQSIQANNNQKNPLNYQVIGNTKPVVPLSSVQYSNPLMSLPNSHTQQTLPSSEKSPEIIVSLSSNQQPQQTLHPSQTESADLYPSSKTPKHLEVVPLTETDQFKDNSVVGSGVNKTPSIDNKLNDKVTRNSSTDDLN